MLLCLAIFCENFVTFQGLTIYYETYIKLLDLFHQAFSSLNSDREPDVLLPQMLPLRMNSDFVMICLVFFVYLQMEKLASIQGYETGGMLERETSKSS